MDLQDRWVIRLLDLFAEMFGGATSYGRGVGAWRDGRGPTQWDRVTVVESWIDPTAPNLPRRFVRLLCALARMRVELRQKVVGCILDGRWVFAK
ncbi:MAG: hypothetical protein HZA54_09535 [Planctomycetes bacterium]|nr:hypothetical protein [Planctomycetota bacterium]